MSVGFWYAMILMLSISSVFISEFCIYKRTFYLIFTAIPVICVCVFVFFVLFYFVLVSVLVFLEFFFLFHVWMRWINRQMSNDKVDIAQRRFDNQFSSFKCNFQIFWFWFKNTIKSRKSIVYFGHFQWNFVVWIAFWALFTLL